MQKTSRLEYSTSHKMENIKALVALGGLSTLVTVSWLVLPIMVLATFVAYPVAVLMGVVVCTILAVGAFVLYLPVIGSDHGPDGHSWAELFLVLCSVIIWPLALLLMTTYRAAFR